MVTYGVIEDVHWTMNSENGILTTQTPIYSVRLPIFHGWSGSDAVPIANLPEARYATPPHMEQTLLQKGDLVYVALLNYNLSDLLILGLLPSSSISGKNGSYQTNGGVSLSNVKYLGFSDDGEIQLPKNTKYATSDGGFVTGDQFKFLKNVKSDIQEQIDDLKKTTWNSVVVEQQEFGTLKEQNALKENTLYFVYIGS